jgi:hypothetical protein
MPRLFLCYENISFDPECDIRRAEGTVGRFEAKQAQKLQHAGILSEHDAVYCA